VSDAGQWWETHSGEEDASEVLHSLFGTGYDHLFASVVLLLEIVLFEPDPVGSAAGLVVFSGVARHFPEISDFLCAWCIANGFLMPSQ